MMMLPYMKLNNLMNTGTYSSSSFTGVGNSYLNNSNGLNYYEISSPRGVAVNFGFDALCNRASSLLHQIQTQQLLDQIKAQTESQQLLDQLKAQTETNRVMELLSQDCEEENIHLKSSNTTNKRKRVTIKEEPISIIVANEQVIPHPTTQNSTIEQPQNKKIKIEQDIKSIDENENNKIIKCKSPKNKKKKQFPCELCNKVFGYKQHVQTHIRTVHLKMRPHQCNICNKAFGEKSALTKHTRTVHKRDRPYGCSKCFQTFGQKAHLKKHQASKFGCL